eukprot:6189517-Pleurochrysis_carterae.AAC.1
MRGEMRTSLHAAPWRAASAEPGWHRRRTVRELQLGKCLDLLGVQLRFPAALSQAVGAPAEAAPAAATAAAAVTAAAVTAEEEAGGGAGSAVAARPLSANSPERLVPDVCIGSELLTQHVRDAAHAAARARARTRTCCAIMVVWSGCAPVNTNAYALAHARAQAPTWPFPCAFANPARALRTCARAHAPTYQSTLQKACAQEHKERDSNSRAHARSVRIIQQVCMNKQVHRRMHTVIQAHSDISAHLRMHKLPLARTPMLVPFGSPLVVHGKPSPRLLSVRTHAASCPGRARTAPPLFLCVAGRQRRDAASPVRPQGLPSAGA